MSEQPDNSRCETEDIRRILLALLGSLLIGLLATTLFENKHAVLIGVVSLLVILWTNEGLPMGVVSLLPLLLFPLFGILEFKAVTVNYAKPVIFLFLGGFLVAIAMKETGLHKVIAHHILSRFPNSARGMIYSLAITAALLSSILSNTTITLMLLPIALFLTENERLKVRFLIATAYGASIGGVMTPIGTPPNLILMGFLEDAGLDTPTFLEWVSLTFPVALLMLLIVPFLLSIGLGHEPVEAHACPPGERTQEQKRLSIILYGLIALLLLNAPLEPFYSGLGLNEKGLLLTFGLLMFAPGIGFLQWNAFKKIPFEIIYLFGAGFSIATAFTHSGIVNEITHYLLVMEHLPLYALLFVVALFVSFSTEVTSNTALISIMLPIFFSLSRQFGLDQQVVLMTATIAASYAFMLPIATPPNAIVMSSGVVRIREMARIGFWINLIGVLTLSMVAYGYWR